MRRRLWRRLQRRRRTLGGGGNGGGDGLGSSTLIGNNITTPAPEARTSRAGPCHPLGIPLVFAVRCDGLAGRGTARVSLRRSHCPRRRAGTDIISGNAGVFTVHDPSLARKFSCNHASGASTSSSRRVLRGCRYDCSGPAAWATRRGNGLGVGVSVAGCDRSALFALAYLTLSGEETLFALADPFLTRARCDSRALYICRRVLLEKQGSVIRRRKRAVVGGIERKTM